jgi:3-hydroxybutyryl-CoA dehydrogenase
VAVIGVVGAGVMGVGVAQELARVGHQVIMVDRNEEILADAARRLERNCRASRLLGGPAVDAAQVLAAVSLRVGIGALTAAELVVENVTEDWAVKREVYRELDRVCAPGTVLIANTSAIPITRIASATSRPEQVVGVHFMNPVPHKKVVELIPGMHTSARSLQRTRDLLAELGKVPVEVRDSCGFVSNRVLMLTVNEAAFLVYEGVAEAAAVDEVFRGCFGHPMGPLETADLIGVDTILQSIEVLHEHYADSKYRPCPLLKQMADAGLHGRKSGRGFYDYSVAGG